MLRLLGTGTGARLGWRGAVSRSGRRAGTLAVSKQAGKGRICLSASGLKPRDWRSLGRPSRALGARKQGAKWCVGVLAFAAVPLLLRFRSGSRFQNPMPTRSARAPQVNVPKGKKTFCKKCKKHAAHKVTQYKTGKASLYAQGARLAAARRRCVGDAVASVEALRRGRCGRWRRLSAVLRLPASALERGLRRRKTGAARPTCAAAWRPQGSGATTGSRAATAGRPSPCSTKRHASHRLRPCQLRLAVSCALAMQITIFSTHSKNNYISSRDSTVIRRRPRRRSCSACSATPASTRTCTPLRRGGRLFAPSPPPRSPLIIFVVALFEARSSACCAALQALRDRWRQEGQGHVAVLGCAEDCALREPVCSPVCSPAAYVLCH